MTFFGCKVNGFPRISQCLLYSTKLLEGSCTRIVQLKGFSAFGYCLRTYVVKLKDAIPRIVQTYLVKAFHRIFIITSPECNDSVPKMLFP